MDLYVANDAVRNFLFRNNFDGTFTEMALLAEVAYGLQGKPQSGMGTDAADYDGDGWPDLFVTKDRKSTRLNSSHGYISYAVFCLKKKKKTIRQRSVSQLSHSEAPDHVTVG